jgi:hypothetical protein
MTDTETDTLDELFESFQTELMRVYKADGAKAMFANAKSIADTIGLDVADQTAGVIYTVWRIAVENELLPHVAASAVAAYARRALERDRGKPDDVTPEQRCAHIAAVTQAEFQRFYGRPAEIADYLTFKAAAVKDEDDVEEVQDDDDVD